jgi:hypothetical protein
MKSVKIFKCINLAVFMTCILSLPPISFAASKSQCPDKILSSDTVEGVYIGIEDGGDDSWATIKLDNGEEFTFIASEDQIEKFFGKIGNRVSAQYELIQFWHEGSDACQRAEILKSGKVLAQSKANAAAPQNSLVGEYIYKERGFEGGLELKSQQEQKHLAISVSTIYERTTGQCAFEGKCTLQGTNLVCEGDDGQLKAVIGKGTIKITEFPQICGTRGEATGIYVKK